MDKVTATIITFNEERKIERCLESISWADEIVVVDSHSTDHTVEICKRFTERVLIRDWPGYIEQKNFAIEKATHDWIFAIDADEEVSPQLQEEIKRLKHFGFMTAGYQMPRKVYYLNRWISHGTWYPDYKIRLFNRKHGKWGGINPHDKIMLTGKCVKLRGDLYHYTYDNLRSHILQINSFSSISAAELKKRGKRPSLLNIVFNPLIKFINSYIIRRGFIDGVAGFYIAVIIRFEAFLKYIKLWELYHFPPSQDN
jgi:glycosyltransferase involved in cell wall biosynthesis